MTVSWEVEFFYKRDGRDPEADEDLEATHYDGRPVFRKVVEADSYEHGESGTIALYYSDDGEMMDQIRAIRDPDIIAIHANRVGEPETPDEDEIAETKEDWEQGKQ